MYGTSDVSYYYETISRILRRKDFAISLTELENMPPYELDIIIEEMVKLINEEKGLVKNVRYDLNITEDDMNHGF